MFYQRKLLNQLKGHLNDKEIVVLTGMRRVGKTTLLKMIYDEIASKNKVFLDIENPVEQKIFEEEDYNNIWANLKSYGINNKNKAYLFLDEIQAKPDIVRAIKYLQDHYDAKFFLTGSSSFYLKNLFPESLAGRKIILELFPLDFEEFLIFKNSPKEFYPSLKQKESKKNKIQTEKLKKMYDEYLEYGGFPQVVLAEEFEQKKNYLNDIFKSYFEKDVRALADFREINTFRDLLLLLLQRVGSKIEITKLASELSTTRATIYSYIAFLQSTYMIDLVPLYSKSIDREVAGAKKIYICDNGLLTQFSRVSSGALLENAVYLNIKQQNKVNYYQKRGGSEIDFILNGKIALEVKEKGSKADYLKLSRSASGINIKEKYIISKSLDPDKGFIPAIEI
ncbi:MAG: ATP-binding protein [bacterium]|nr:ATP-binding protein [bacterium]